MLQSFSLRPTFLGAAQRHAEWKLQLLFFFQSFNFLAFYLFPELFFPMQTHFFTLNSAHHQPSRKIDSNPLISTDGSFCFYCSSAVVQPTRCYRNPSRHISLSIHTLHSLQAIIFANKYLLQDPILLLRALSNPIYSINYLRNQFKYYLHC